MRTELASVLEQRQPCACGQPRDVGERCWGCFDRATERPPELFQAWSGISLDQLHDGYDALKARLVDCEETGVAIGRQHERFADVWWRFRALLSLTEALEIEMGQRE